MIIYSEKKRTLSSGFCHFGEPLSENKRNQKENFKNKEIKKKKKIDKYSDPDRVEKAVEHESDGDSNGGLGKENRKNQDHPDHNIVKIG